jgi:hypothetical protein
MGKRSSFKRIEKDLYRTIDPRAVERLLPFLNPSDTYAEPCYGNGDLEDELMLHGIKCGWRSDIVSDLSWVVQKDALKLTPEDVKNCDIILTNPPWSRYLLHPMIDKFVGLKPTWLLFDSDWCHTKQSARFMKDYCTDIVSVGRLIWIPGTRISGKDNCSWYRFEKDKQNETRFHGR